MNLPHMAIELTHRVGLGQQKFSYFISRHSYKRWSLFKRFISAFKRIEMVSTLPTLANPSLYVYPHHSQVL